MPTECIEWQGATGRDGYGQTSTGSMIDGTRRTVNAHRAVIARMFGWETIKPYVVMHTCDNPPCVNPAHLRLGTQADNIADRTAKGRWDVNGRTRAVHGSRSMYSRHNCRCLACVEANANYKRAWRARKASQ